MCINILYTCYVLHSAKKLTLNHMHVLASMHDWCAYGIIFVVFFFFFNISPLFLCEYITLPLDYLKSLSNRQTKRELVCAFAFSFSLTLKRCRIRLDFTSGLRSNVNESTHTHTEMRFSDKVPVHPTIAIIFDLKCSSDFPLDLRYWQDPQF